ncbi:sensor histidine kinase [Streptoalloteichus hindustanus]|uniref:Signal transduction histidine-protein kinase/phosphatase MprB n=1 Tax=Streptoalloteichus hindustanus TaxID=2017 RepID=A0A1M5K570_STRHI|nr:ATP-binding protein [Streptoalloteichus hindustanus]SHG47935.1 Signal transduction histidine kinase [Streptoalloteichus hindustanus]
MRRRILLGTLLAVLVTAVALGLPLGYTAMRVVEDITRAELKNRAQQIAATMDNQLATLAEVNLEEVKLAVPQGGRLVVTSRTSGEERYGVDPGPDALVETVPIVHEGRVELSAPSGPLRNSQTEVALLVGLLVVLSVGVGMIVASLTAHRMAEPLRHVARRAARLGAGDFRPDAKRHGVAELDRVAEALDASATALAQLLQRERNLVGDVSHQLRSRLTALQLRLEALATHPEPATADEARAALEQAERLSGALDELLASARAARQVGAEPLDLAEELPAIGEDWREPLRAGGRVLRLRVPPGLLARATRARLREAIGVLLDNALRHGGGTVTLSARRGEGTVVVEVTDSGPGVPDELVPHIFERGVSGAGSTGVGLALARALVEADGGRLELNSPRPATFSVFLRVARADDVLGVPWRADATPR